MSYGAIQMDFISRLRGFENRILEIGGKYQSQQFIVRIAMFDREGLSDRIKGYMDGAQEKINQEYNTRFSNLTPSTLSLTGGTKYTKIVVTHKDINNREGQSSVFAFIDRTNGNILKPANWKAPAKHARGNVFDADYGLSRTSWTGPNYLT